MRFRWLEVMKKAGLIIAALLVGLALVGCSNPLYWSKRNQGAAIGGAGGAGLGAIAGSQVGHPLGGAAIGGAAGAAAGALVGNELDKMGAEMRSLEAKLLRQERQLRRQKKQLAELKKKAEADEDVKTGD